MVGGDGVITVEGKTLNEIAAEHDIPIGTIRHRYVMGDRTYERLSRKPMKRGNHVRNTYYCDNQGARLRDVFLQSDLTFAELSRRTGIRPTTIKSFMYYGNDISSVRLMRLCAELGTSMDYVMGLKGAM